MKINILYDTTTGGRYLPKLPRYAATIAHLSFMFNPKEIAMKIYVTDDNKNRVLKYVNDEMLQDAAEIINQFNLDTQAVFGHYIKKQALRKQDDVIQRAILVHKLRKEKKYKQLAVSELLNLDHSTIYNYEKLYDNLSNYNYSVFSKLLDKLNKTVRLQVKPIDILNIILRKRPT